MQSSDQGMYSDYEDSPVHSFKDGGGERPNRVLLRPWLENMLESRCIQGLEWFDNDRTMFRVPWKHRSKKDWSMRHSSVFLEWAKNTGRWSEGDPAPNYAQLKTRLRCAFNKAPDIDEMKEYHYSKGEEPYKVYRFNNCRDSKGNFTRIPGPPRPIQPVMAPGSSQSVNNVNIKYEKCEEECVFEMEPYYEEMVYNDSYTSSADEDGASAPSSSFQKVGEMYRPKHNVDGSSDGNVLNSSKGIQADDDVDSKLNVIPLSVELMASASDGSESDRESSERSEVEQQKSCDEKRESGSPVNNSSMGNSSMGNPNIAVSTASKLYLLQVASLFVEADEKRKLDESSLKLTNAREMSGKTVPANLSLGKTVNLSNCPTGNLPDCVISDIETRSSVHEITSEGEVTSGYVTPTDKEAASLLTKDKYFQNSVDVSLNVSMHPNIVDLTKTSHPESSISSNALDLTKKINVIKPKPSIKPEASANVNGDLRFTDKLPKPMISINIQESCDRSMQMGMYKTMNLMSKLSASDGQDFQEALHEICQKVQQIHEKEGELMKMKDDLKAKEDTLYWKGKYFESEMASKGLSGGPVQKSTPLVPTQSFPRMSFDPLHQITRVDSVVQNVVQPQIPLGCVRLKRMNEPENLAGCKVLNVAGSAQEVLKKKPRLAKPVKIDLPTSAAKKEIKFVIPACGIVNSSNLSVRSPAPGLLHPRSNVVLPLRFTLQEPLSISNNGMFNTSILTAGRKLNNIDDAQKSQGPMLMTDNTNYVANAGTFVSNLGSSNSLHHVPLKFENRGNGVVGMGVIQELNEAAKVNNLPAIHPKTADEDDANPMDCGNNFEDITESESEQDQTNDDGKIDDQGEKIGVDCSKGQPTAAPSAGLPNNLKLILASFPCEVAPSSGSPVVTTTSTIGNKKIDAFTMWLREQTEKICKDDQPQDESNVKNRSLSFDATVQNLPLVISINRLGDASPESSAVLSSLCKSDQVLNNLSNQTNKPSASEADNKSQEVTSSDSVKCVGEDADENEITSSGSDPNEKKQELSVS